MITLSYYEYYCVAVPTARFRSGPGVTEWDSFPLPTPACAALGLYRVLALFWAAFLSFDIGRLPSWTPSVLFRRLPSTAFAASASITSATWATTIVRTCSFLLSPIPLFLSRTSTTMRRGLYFQNGGFYLV